MSSHTCPVCQKPTTGVTRTREPERRLCERVTPGRQQGEEWTTYEPCGHEAPPATDLGQSLVHASPTAAPPWPSGGSTFDLPLRLLGVDQGDTLRVHVDAGEVSVGMANEHGPRAILTNEDGKPATQVARHKAAELLLGLTPPPNGWTARAFAYERDHHLLTGLDHDKDLVRGYGDMAMERHPARAEEIRAAVDVLVQPTPRPDLPAECGMATPTVAGRCGRDAGHDGPHRSTGTTFAAYWEDRT